MKIISLELSQNFLNNKPNKDYIQPKELVSAFEKNRLCLQQHMETDNGANVSADTALESIYLMCELIQRYDLKTGIFDVEYSAGAGSKANKFYTMSLNDLRNYFYHRLDASLILNRSFEVGSNFRSKNLNELLELVNILDLKGDSIINLSNENSIITQAVKFSINKFINLNAKKNLTTMVNKMGNIENVFASKYNNVASISLATCRHELENLAMPYVDNRNNQLVALNGLLENKDFMDIFIGAAEAKLKKSIRDVKTLYDVSLELSTTNNKIAFAYCAARINAEKRFFDKLSQNFSYKASIKASIRRIFSANQELLSNIKIFASDKNSSLAIELLRHGESKLEYSKNLNSESECLFEMSCRSEYFIDYSGKSHKFIGIFSSIKQQISSIAKLLKDYSYYSYHQNYQEKVYSNINDLLNILESCLSDIKQRKIRNPNEKSYLVNYIFTILGIISNLDEMFQVDFSSVVCEIISKYLNIFKSNLVCQWYDESHKFIRVKPVLLTSEEKYLNNVVLKCKRTAIEMNEATRSDEIELRYYPKGAIGCPRKFLLADGKDKNFKAVKMYTDEGFTHSFFSTRDSTRDIIIDISKKQKDAYGDYKKSIKLCWLFNGTSTVDSLMKKVSQEPIDTVADEVKERLSI